VALRKCKATGCIVLQKGRMHMNLVITEKPSQARSYAAVLGATERGDGFLMGGGHIVTWCFGHLLELATPDTYGERYKKWNYADLPIIPQEWLHIPAKEKSAQLQIVVALMNRADVSEIINACDAGREGELIFRLVYEYAKCTKPIKRLWISSMEDAAVREGFANLKDGAEYDNLCAAAKCREQADWLVGISATRLFSVLYGVTLNVGRVQSPTLAMLVGREAEIASFVAMPFYTVELDGGGLAASSGRFADKAEAESVAAACSGATITDVKQTEKSVAPPKLYDLTTLQRECNRAHSYTAQQTLEYVQSLYEKKLATYPRTDSRYLTADMAAEVTALVATLAPDAPCDTTRVINPAKVSDHHAIIPTAAGAAADLSALPSGERTVLEMLRTRLVCAVGEPHRYLETVVILIAGGTEFTAKGKTVIHCGWKSTAKPLGDEQEDEAPAPLDVIEGLSFPVCASIQEGATSPPKHFTEDTLLRSMETAGGEDMPDDAERKGLGTPATRAGIIEKIIKSGFVERQKKNLLPTDKGKNLIAVLPDTLKSPSLTAEWEQKLLAVQRGELASSAFMDGIAEFIRVIVRDNPSPKMEHLPLFAESAKPSGASLGVCPRCGQAVREGDKGFFCDNRSCGFKLWKNAKFWTSKKKPLTAAIVAALLKDGRVAVKGLYSKKTGKKYDATIVLDDTGQYINFKLQFDTRGKA
jgi:DNA topoisomerase-3